jgi:uncharacterized protein
MIETLDLLDWKRRISDLYREIRASSDPQRAWRRWRAVRDELFATHPQSPVPASARGTFAGLSYFDYAPRARVLADVTESPHVHYDIATSSDSSYRFTRFAVASFELSGRLVSLELYWLEGYGGGVFLPFRDATGGAETYGGGRYLLDTVKGSDLGGEGGRLILDFNFAYNPSCVYDPRWNCPLTPAANRLPLPVCAGERLPPS